MAHRTNADHIQDVPALETLAAEFNAARVALRRIGLRAYTHNLSTRELAGFCLVATCGSESLDRDHAAAFALSHGWEAAATLLGGAA